MSRKNRNRFRNREANRPAPAIGVAGVSGSGNGSAVVQASQRSLSATASASSGAFAQHTAEYKIIGRDLLRLVILNGVMLSAVLVLYFANRSSGIVEKLFNQIF